MAWWVALWLLVAPVFAQEAPPVPAANDAALESDLEAAALYRVGLDLVANGDYAEACRVFDRIVDRYPASPHALKAEEQMALAALAEGGAACGGAAPQAPAPAQSTARRPGDDGMVELTISQGLLGPALFGLFIPYTVCGEWGCHPAVHMAGALVGLGVGIATPLLIAKRNRISMGQAMLVYAGESIGGLNGAMIMAAQFGYPRTDAMFRTVTTGTVLGGVLGTVAAVWLKPTAGQVAVFRSGFSWAAYVAGLSFFIWPAWDGDAAFTRVIVIADIGAVLGAIAGTLYDVSRSRVNLVNLSGYAGAASLALLYGLGVTITDGYVSQGAMFAALAVGAIGGLGAGIAATRNMDTAALAFLGRGSVLGVEDGRVALGMPLPAPRLGPERSLGVQLSVAHGGF